MDVALFLIFIGFVCCLAAPTLESGGEVAACLATGLVLVAAGCLAALLWRKGK